HTWLPAVDEQQLGVPYANYRARSWYAVNSGSTTPTVTFSGANYWVVCVSEYTGVDLTNPLDVASVANGGASASPTSCAAGAITPVTDGAMLYSVLAPGDANGGDPTAITVPTQGGAWSSIVTSLTWNTD